MTLLLRIAEVIVPVFLIVGIGWAYARRASPDLTSFNRITLDVLAPLLVYAALAAREFRLADHTLLLAGGAGVMAGSGLLGWALSRFSGAQVRTLAGQLVAWPLCELLGLQGVARAQLLLFAALPPAVVQFLLAERYRQEPEKVAAMIMLGNALALVSVPLALALGL